MEYNKSSYLVKSATRPDVWHLVDLEGDEDILEVCTCEAFVLGKKVCKHIKTIKKHIKKIK